VCGLASNNDQVVVAQPVILGRSPKRYFFGVFEFVSCFTLCGKLQEGWAVAQPCDLGPVTETLFFQRELFHTLLLHLMRLVGAPLARDQSVQFSN
jgi:hypothetical protein